VKYGRLNTAPAERATDSHLVMPCPDQPPNIDSPGAEFATDPPPYDALSVVAPSTQHITGI